MHKVDREVDQTRWQLGRWSELLRVMAEQGAATGVVRDYARRIGDLRARYELAESRLEILSMAGSDGESRGQLHAACAQDESALADLPALRVTLPRHGATDSVDAATPTRSTPSGSERMMETERQALARLRLLGFTESFHANENRLVASDGRCVAPETCSVDEIVRFEGSSNPDDEAMLFALEASDGTRGTYLVAFGAWMDPGDTDLALRLGARA